MEYGKRVIALGFFDGVHSGHGALLRAAAGLAGELGVEPSVISFDTPPGKTIDGKTVPMITSPLDRADIMRRIYGIGDLIFLHFDDELRHMPWDRSVERLENDFGAVGLVAGYDFRFGYLGAGNADLLEQKCAELGLRSVIVPPVVMGGEPVSSTRVRRLLLDGRCEEANALLGHRHFLTDTVRSGYRFGRTLGTPTINMRFEDGVLVPRHGVYIAEAHILRDCRRYPAVTNIGVRPSVGGTTEVSVESHLLGYSGNLYGQPIRVEFYKFLRDEIRFDKIEALRDQIRSDAARTLQFFDRNPIDPFDYPEWK